MTRTLVPRLTYAKTRTTEPVNVLSKHFYRPKCWAKWAREYPVVGHNHLDPPDTDNRDHLTPQKRAEVVRKGGKASSRAGIRHGFGGHKHLQDLVDRRAFEEGKRIVDVMVKRGIVDKENAGSEALAYAIGVVRGEGIPVKDRLTAARMVLDFTVAKPAAKQDVRVTVEDFLADLADEANQDTTEE